MNQASDQQGGCSARARNGNPHSIIQYSIYNIHREWQTKLHMYFKFYSKLKIWYFYPMIKWVLYSNLQYHPVALLGSLLHGNLGHSFLALAQGHVVKLPEVDSETQLPS